MKILVDMNLSPEWVSVLRRHGWEAQRWDSVGSPNAPDEELIAWAAAERWIILTQDLDFSRILFATQLRWPSVVLLRVRDELDFAMRESVCATLAELQTELEYGVFVTWTPRRVRLRQLPIGQR